MAGYDRRYFLKKAWALYPGIVKPASASFLFAHYERRRTARGALRIGIDALAGLVFHAWIPWRAARVQRKFALDAAWRRRAIRIARACFADPNDIALFRIERPEQFDGYIRRFEDAALNKRINPRGWSPDCALADKRRFAARCLSAALPHVETVAIIDDAGVQLFGNPAGLSLIAKPVKGEGGDGLRPLDACPDHHALSNALLKLWKPRDGALLVQARVQCHAALADLALSALPTVRIVTIIDEAGAPEIVSATFRCASDPDAHVDNMKAGGLIAPVDLECGALGIACLGYGGGDYVAHPVTGGVIAGRSLPEWPAAAGLAIKAHRQAFADYALVGWDVALTENGPLLIEGNGKPGVLMPQRAARRGLGEGRYGALLAHHLATKP